MITLTCVGCRVLCLVCLEEAIGEQNSNVWSATSLCSVSQVQISSADLVISSCNCLLLWYCCMPGSCQMSKKTLAMGVHVSLWLCLEWLCNCALVLFIHGMVQAAGSQYCYQIYLLVFWLFPFVHVVVSWSRVWFLVKLMLCFPC